MSARDVGLRQRDGREYYRPCGQRGIDSGDDVVFVGVAEHFDDGVIHEYMEGV
jgi:hypothetical protein